MVWFQWKGFLELTILLIIVLSPARNSPGITENLPLLSNSREGRHHHWPALIDSFIFSADIY